MAEIEINLSALEDSITKLDNLTKNWDANDTTPPTTVGGGKTVAELEAVAECYQELNKGMVNLARNTAAFFKNIKESYQDSDHKAAIGISGGR